MSEPKICQVGGSGLVLPLFEAEQKWNNVGRTFLYGIVLAYFFVGVSVVADAFMAAIETITACVIVTTVRGKTKTVKIWNETVSSLTLMALGSSAPEILLSVVETLKNENFSGDIGPSTILGSAAFNLLMIVAVCISTIPTPDTRKIDANPVFFLTAACSLFAYVWMVIIVEVSSPNVIDIWEGLVTFLLLPLMVVASWATDKGWLFPGGSNAVESQATNVESNRPDGKDGNLDGNGHDLESPGILAFENERAEVSCGNERLDCSFNVTRRGHGGKASCKYNTRSLTAVPGYDFEEASGTLDFAPDQSSAEVRMAVLPRRPGQRRVVFQLVLEEASGAIFDAAMDGGEECQVLTVGISPTQVMGNPTGLGARSFNMLDRYVKVASLKRGMGFWQEQIREAVCCCGGEEEEEQDSGDDGLLAWFKDKLVAALVYPWSCLYALFIPPPQLMGGWLCFWVALAQLGLLTAVIVDLAELFGCVADVKDSITAISFVALGTSMPDFFASKIAAIQDDNADASIVNVTGSNSFNVFLGIGVPWSIASIYWAVTGPTEKWRKRYPDYADKYHPHAKFVVPGDDLSFFVVTFIVIAIIALALIRARRVFYGAELGGPFAPKVWSSFVLVSLWAYYMGIAVWKGNNPSASDGEKWGRAAWALGITLAICVVFIPAAKIWEKVYYPTGNSSEVEHYVPKEEVIIEPQK
mmetsp:Transcript_59858/g.118671  ORF Transcript_59858/g.118671 Transcript_59858/m.118671 type:complete len:698 (-) Transcript_59858:52-2145(-)